MVKSFYEFVDDKKIVRLAEALVRNNINVEAFCDWYYEQYLLRGRLDEGAIGDWFRKLGHGIRRIGTPGGFSGGWQGQDQRNAIDNAIQSLQNLQQKIPGFGGEAFATAAKTITDTLQQNKDKAAEGQTQSGQAGPYVQANVPGAGDNPPATPEQPVWDISKGNYQPGNAAATSAPNPNPEAATTATNASVSKPPPDPALMGSLGQNLPRNAGSPKPSFMGSLGRNRRRPAPVGTAARGFQYN